MAKHSVRLSLLKFDNNNKFVPNWTSLYKKILPLLPELSPASFNTSSGNEVNPNRFKKFFSSELLKTKFLIKLEEKIDYLIKNLNKEHILTIKEQYILNIGKLIDRLELEKYYIQGQKEKICLFKDQCNVTNLFMDLVDSKTLMSQKLSVFNLADYNDFVNYFAETIAGEALNDLHNSYKELSSLNDYINDLEYIISNYQNFISDINVQINDFEHKLNSIETKLFNRANDIAIVEMNMDTDNPFVLSQNIKDITDVLQKLEDKILNNAFDLFPVVTIKNADEVMNKSKINVQGMDRIKVLVVDSFHKNEQIISSTFYNDKLDSYLSDNSKAKKLEGSFHAAHVCGIILQSSNNCVELEIVDAKVNWDEIEVADAQIINLSNGSGLISGDEEYLKFFQKNTNCLISV